MCLRRRLGHWFRRRRLGLRGRRGLGHRRRRGALGRYRLDHAVFHQAGEERERRHLSKAQLIGDRGDIPFAVDRQERAPTVRRERHRALIGGLLGKLEARTVVRDLLSDGAEPVAGFGCSFELSDEVARLEVRFRRRVPGGELEVGLAQREDRAERVLAAFGIHHCGDEPARGEPERADLAVAAHL